MLDVMIAYLRPEGSATLSFVGKEKDPSIGQLGLDLVFQTKDKKYITAGAVTNKEWKGMCVAFKRLDLINNEKFSTPNARVKFKEERRKLIAKEISKYKASQILKAFQKEEVPSAPILDRIELLKNEQIQVNKIINFYESKVYGKIRAPRPAPIYSKTPLSGDKLAPLLGENSIEILKELNYSNREIEIFLKGKITSK